MNQQSGKRKLASGQRLLYPLPREVGGLQRSETTGNAQPYGGSATANGSPDTSPRLGLRASRSG